MLHKKNTLIDPWVNKRVVSIEIQFFKTNYKRINFTKISFKTDKDTPTTSKYAFLGKTQTMYLYSHIEKLNFFGEGILFCP